MRRGLAVLVGLLLTGCTTSLPSMHTEGPWAGRCVTHNFIPGLDLGAFTAAGLMDGWKCWGLADGDLPRTGTKAEFDAELRANIKAARATGKPLVYPGRVPAPPAPTWATGE